MIRDQRIPIFPLPMVLFPRMPLPLHIFELRYRKMLHRCMEEQDEFGVILHQGSELTQTGSTALVEGLIQEYKDGRFDVLIMGRERFKVRRFFEEKSHLEAEVQFFHDEPGGRDGGYTGELARTAAETLLVLASLEHFPVDGELLKDMSPEELSLLVSGTNLFDVPEKQQLLESTDTAFRLERGISRIEERIHRLRAEEKLERIFGEPFDFTSLRN